MTSFLHRLTARKASPKQRDGFTLTEVLVAGGMFSMVMASSAQLMVSSLSSSGATAQRQRIEGAINDNIQLIYQADIRLAKSFETNKRSLQAACESPAAFLASELNQIGNVSHVPALVVSGGRHSERIRRTITPDPTNGLTQVVYHFQGPEHNVQGEQRVVELHPRFQIHCEFGSQTSAGITETSPAPERTSSKRKRSKPARTSRKKRLSTATRQLKKVRRNAQTTDPTHPTKQADQRTKPRQTTIKVPAKGRSSRRCSAALRRRKAC